MVKPEAFTVSNVCVLFFLSSNNLLFTNRHRRCTGIRPLLLHHQIHRAKSQHHIHLVLRRQQLLCRGHHVARPRNHSRHHSARHSPPHSRAHQAHPARHPHNRGGEQSRHGRLPLALLAAGAAHLGSGGARLLSGRGRLSVHSRTGHLQERQLNHQRDYVRGREPGPVLLLQVWVGRVKQRGGSGL